MFEKIAFSPVVSASKPLPSLPLTGAFLSCVKAQGFRLSYGALALAARELGEDVNKQIPAQRGGKLVKALPLELQPFVCKKSGKYSKGVDWLGVDVPENLGDRPVIVAESVGEALRIYQENSAS